MLRVYYRVQCRVYSSESVNRGMLGETASVRIARCRALDSNRKSDGDRKSNWPAVWHYYTAMRLHFTRGGIRVRKARVNVMYVN